MEGSPTTRGHAHGTAASTRAGRALPLLVLSLGVVGGLILVVAELTTIASVDIPGRTCREVANPEAVERCELSGFERHGGALLLLGALAVLMSLGAARSRPAGAALIVIAAVGLGFALLRDLPEAGRTGAIGIAYEGAEGQAGAGLYLEVVGSLLLAAAGTLTYARAQLE